MSELLYNAVESEAMAMRVVVKDEVKNNDDTGEQPDQIDQYIKDLAKFYDTFAEKLELFDPIDRPLYDEDRVND
jgi:hypothetical protein